jgi:rod shape-determining protein MreC
LVLIARQVDQNGVSLLESVVLGAFAPLQSGAARILDGVRSVASLWPDLRAANEEKDRLLARAERAELLLLEQRAAVEENARLRALLELAPRLPMRTIVADVVARDGSPWFRSLSIDKGAQHGVAPGGTVLTALGLIGRVVSTTARSAQVQLLVDRDSGVAALTERSRVDGVVSGQGADAAGDNLLLMKYVPSLADVHEGDIVVTSGLDGLFREGVVVGSVRRVSPPSGLFKDVWIQPSSAPGFAEQVFVTLGEPADAKPDPDPSDDDDRLRGSRPSNGKSTAPKTRATPRGPTDGRAGR